MASDAETLDGAFDHASWEGRVEALACRYAAGAPHPHIVLEGLLDPVLDHPYRRGFLLRIYHFVKRRSGLGDAFASRVLRASSRLRDAFSRR